MRKVVYIGNSNKMALNLEFKLFRNTLGFWIERSGLGGRTSPKRGVPQRRTADVGA